MSPVHVCRGIAIYLAFASSVVLLAQDAPKPAGGLSPEQMVDEALRRFDAGDYNEAYNFMTKAEQLKPDIEKLWLIKGLLYLEARPKRGPEAIKLLTDYNQTPEGRNDFRGNAAIGRAYKDSRMYRLATAPLDKAKKLAPMEQDGKPLRALIAMDLADAYYGLRNEKQAVVAAKEAESLAPNDSGIQLALGKIAANTKDYDTAIKAIDRAIGLLNAKARTDPFRNEDIKRLVEAAELKIKLYGQKLDENPKDAIALYELAVAWRERADIDHRMNLMKARESGLKGIAFDAKLYRLQVLVASVEAELGAFQDAVDRLNDTINADPENQAAIKLRSEIQAKLNEPKL
jgi:tetratricopeptide (TPR) repeat protein